MKITAIRVYRIPLPLKSPYRFAGGELSNVESTVVKITTDAGLSGFGECCPCGPTYAPEHAAGARAALQALAPHLIKTDALALNRCHDVMEQHLNGHAYAKAAIDIALWDLAGKHHGARICDLLGGARSEKVPSYHAIGSTTPDEAARIAREKKQQGFSRLQVKVGGRPVE